MKKILLFAIMIISFTAESQTFGIKGGLNLSNVSNLYFEEADPQAKLGLNAGAFVNIPVSSSISLQPEVLFNAKGLKYGSGTDELNYISVPLMLQYNIIPGLYIEGGPEVSYLLSAKDKFNGTSNYEAETIDYTDELNKIDVGVGIGIGYNITQNFGLNARYVPGLFDIYKETTEGDIAKNSVFQFGIYYKFINQ